MELPRLRTLYQKLQPRGFQIVAVDVTKDTANAARFIRENGLPYRFVENGEGKEEFVNAAFGVNDFPISYIVDSTGKIVRVHIGFEEGDEKEFEKQIVELLSSVPAPD